MLDRIVRVLRTFCLRRSTTHGNEISLVETQNDVFLRHYEAEAAEVSETRDANFGSVKLFVRLVTKKGEKKSI